MKAYSYVVARDHGFAPNPFYRYCTLATCKPEVRKRAVVGDWVIGWGAAADRASQRLVYAMRVDEKLHFNEYWNSKIFQCKKPVMNGSLKQMYGDNIYHFVDSESRWVQADSHHSLEDGTENEVNKDRDLKSEHVLMSSHFWYFGGKPIEVPTAFKETAEGICCTGRGHRTTRDERLILQFIGWLEGEKPCGYHADPREFTDFRHYGGERR